MARALELAVLARGTTSPNPPVGAVVVRDDTIVGEGFTRPPGGLHAERVALLEAGKRAEGASLFVTLEPCSHWGRTPPCTDAVLEAGIRKVHVGAVDPNPLVAGNGIRTLREHGVTVMVEPNELAEELIEPHAMFSVHGRPFVTVAVDPPDSVYRHLLRGADLVVAEHQLPASLGAHSKPQVLMARPRKLDPETGITWGSWKDLLHVIPKTSLVVLAGTTADGRAIYEELLAEGLVDKIVASPEAALPPQFEFKRWRSKPDPHMIAYPHE
jgi:pyrimidine deaminase RibD-like protein